MNKKQFKIAGILMAVGLLVCLLTFALSGFQFDFLSSNQTVIEKSYDTKTDITSITVDTEHTKINVIPTDDNTIHVEYSESDIAIYEITESNGALNIEYKNQREWHDYIKILDFQEFEPQELTMYVPSKFNGDIDLTTGYENIDIKGLQNTKTISLINRHASTHASNLSASGAIYIESSYEPIVLENITSKDSVEIENSHGEIDIKNMEVDKKLSLSSDYASIKLDTVTSASDIDLENAHGSISLNKVSTNTMLNATTSYDSVIFNEVTIGKKASVIAEHSSLTFDGFIANEVVAKTSYDSIDINNIDIMNISFDVDHGGVFGNITGSMNDYKITTNCDNGSTNLPNKKDVGTRILSVSTSYDDIDITFTSDK